MICLQVEPGQHEISGNVGLRLERLPRVRTRGLGVTLLLPHQRQPGMGGGVGAIDLQRCLKLAFGLQNESLIEKAHPCLGKRGRVFLRRQGAQAILFHLFHFEGSLPERGFVERPLYPLQGHATFLRSWIEGGVQPRARRSGRGHGMLRFTAKLGLEVLCLGILRAQLHHLADRPQRRRNVLLAAHGHGEVELIVRIVGVGRHRLLEECSGIMATAADCHALVVDHFR